MRHYAVTTIIFAVLPYGCIAGYNILSALAPHTPTVTPAFALPSVRSAPSQVHSHDHFGLELRQVPPVTVSSDTPVTSSTPTNPPADPPAAVLVPLPATKVEPVPPLVTGDDFITVQWVETHIGTLRTWVPKTQTFHFEAMSQAPLPGVGGIGMGTLTGKTGQTQTIYMVVNAAPTPAPDMKGVAAAMAVGLAGLLI